jgi:hypothetical protein
LNEEPEPREWEYNGVQQRVQLSVEDSHGKLVIKKELEVSL